MPIISKAYTRLGDEGKTSGRIGKRVYKNCQSISVFGTLDELNSNIGFIISLKPKKSICSILRDVQNDLFHLGSSIYSSANELPRGPRITETNVKDLERLIDKYSKNLKPMPNFVCPGGCKTAAQIHITRTLCRRAEREAVSLSKLEKIDENNLYYLNRLSSLLFVLARYENASSNVREFYWDSKR